LQNDIEVVGGHTSTLYLHKLYSASDMGTGHCSLSILQGQLYYNYYGYQIKGFVIDAMVDCVAM
jgi:hypothetical protein